MTTHAEKCLSLIKQYTEGLISKDEYILAINKITNIQLSLWEELKNDYRYRND